MTGKIPDTSKGLFFMFLATIVLACMHGMVRHLGAELHPFVIAFYRNLFGLIAILPLVFRIGISGLRTAHPRLMVLRSVSGIIAMLTWFYGLATVPTAEATALSFTAAIFSALAAFFFLDEKMRLRRWLAIGGGFIGVIVVLQPNAANFNPNMLLILVSCVFWGLSVTLVKYLTKTDSTTSIVAWMGILLTVMSLPPALAYWQWPGTGDLLLAGAYGCDGHLGPFVHGQGPVAGRHHRCHVHRLRAPDLGGNDRRLFFLEMPSTSRPGSGPSLFLPAAYTSYSENRWPEKTKAD